MATLDLNGSLGLAPDAPVVAEPLRNNIVGTTDQITSLPVRDESAPEDFFAVPEPTTALVAFGILPILRRRKNNRGN